MHTTIEIDHSLMAKAMEAGQFRTKEATVEEGLRLLVQIWSQGRIRELRGNCAGNVRSTRYGVIGDRYQLFKFVQSKLGDLRMGWRGEISGSIPLAVLNNW